MASSFPLPDLAVADLTSDEQRALYYDWQTWARPEQLQPAGDWRYWFVCAGRGWGKTRTGAETCRLWAQAGLSPILIAGRTAADVRDILIEGPSGILTTAPPWFRPNYQPSR